VTSFPNLAGEYFRKLAPEKHTNISTVSGSVEVACSLGLADGIGGFFFFLFLSSPFQASLPILCSSAVDLVETGSTMRAAGLELIDVVMETEAVLISNPHMKPTPISEKLAKRIKGYVLASKTSMITYNVPKALLPQVCSLSNLP